MFCVAATVQNTFVCDVEQTSGTIRSRPETIMKASFFDLPGPRSLFISSRPGGHGRSEHNDWLLQVARASCIQQRARAL